MYQIKSIRHFILAFIAVTGLLSCSTEDDSGPSATNTIAELVANSPDLSILHAAIVRAGLEATLQTSGSRTLFAPTDTAFNLFLANANFASIDDVPVPVLQKLILNHVLGARVEESLLRAIGKNYTESLADGPVANTKLALYFDARGATIIINGMSDITDGDIGATNGIIHVVDAVLDLPTVANFVQANDAYSKLTTALTTATPATNFMAMLSGSTSYTLFAPPNEAIDDLLDTNPAWTTVNDIEESELTAILEHHIISGNVRSSDISNNDTAVTLEGDLITFTTANGQLDITDGSGNAQITVVIADVQAINGVIHAVEKVLIPDTTN